MGEGTGEEGAGDCGGESSNRVDTRRDTEYRNRLGSEYRIKNSFRDVHSEFKMRWAGCGLPLLCCWAEAIDSGQTRAAGGSGQLAACLGGGR